MVTAAAVLPRLRPRSMPWPAVLAFLAGSATLVAALAVVVFLVDGVYSGPVALDAAWGAALVLVLLAALLLLAAIPARRRMEAHQ